MEMEEASDEVVTQAPLVQRCVSLPEPSASSNVFSAAEIRRGRRCATPRNDDSRNGSWLEQTVRELREELRQRHESLIEEVEQRLSDAHSEFHRLLQSETADHRVAVAGVSTAVDGLTAVEALAVRQQAQIDDLFSAVHGLRASLGTTQPQAPPDAADSSSEKKLSILSGRFNNLEATVRAVTERVSGLQPPGVSLAAASAGGADSGAGAGAPTAVSFAVPRVLRPSQEPVAAHVSRSSSPFPQPRGSSARLAGPPPTSAVVQASSRMATPPSVLSPSVPPGAARGFNGAGSPVGTPLVGGCTSPGVPCQPTLRSPSGVGLPRAPSHMCPPTPGSASPPVPVLTALPFAGPYGRGAFYAEAAPQDDLTVNAVTVHTPALPPGLPHGKYGGHVGVVPGGVPRLAIGAIGFTSSPDPSPRTSDGSRRRTGPPSQGPCLTNFLHGRAMSGTRSPTPPGTQIPGTSVWKVHR